MTGIGPTPDVGGATFRIRPVGHCVCKRLFARLPLRGFGSLPAQDASGVQGLPDIWRTRRIEGFLGCFAKHPASGDGNGTIIPAPYFRKHGKKPGLVAFIDGVTAAAIGTITGAVVVLGKRSIVDLPTVLMMLITILLIWKVKKLPEPVIVALAAVAGLLIYPLLKISYR